MSARLTDQIAGRTISQSVFIRLVPDDHVSGAGTPELAAMIGRGLITEAMRTLQDAAEREGFKVEVELGQVIA